MTGTLGPHSETWRTVPSDSSVLIFASTTRNDGGGSVGRVPKCGRRVWQRRRGFLGDEAGLEHGEETAWLLRSMSRREVAGQRASRASRVEHGQPRPTTAAGLVPRQGWACPRAALQCSGPRRRGGLSFVACRRSTRPVSRCQQGRGKAAACVRVERARMARGAWRIMARPWCYGGGVVRHGA